MEKFGKYEIIEEIGRGRCATVYKARDTESDRVVALKILGSDWVAIPDFAACFHEEMKAVAWLRNPHIVTVYKAGEVEDQLYIAMDYLPGRTLQALLDDEGALSPERALPILKQIAEAVDRAHARGVVHWDLRPANVMLEETEQGVRAILMDFGLAKAMTRSTPRASRGGLPGSSEYTAPEQSAPRRTSAIGPAADRYVLGVIAYRMLTGQVPFPGDTPATLEAHMHKPVPLPRSLQPELTEPMSTVLLKMLSKAPADRFGSARAFALQLQEATTDDSQMQKRESQLAPLYKQLRAAATGENWAEAVALSKQIQAMDESYRDVSYWTTHVRERLHHPRRRRAVAWGVGGLAVLALAAGLVVTQGRLGHGAVPVPTPSPMSTTVQAHVPLAPTAIPEATAPAPTNAPAQPTQPPPTPTPPSLTPTSMPTDTPTPEPTPVPVRPTLIEPVAGATLGNNIAVFRWKGELKPGQSYVVYLRHRVSGWTWGSGPVAATCWETILPVEQFGEWLWQIQVVKDGTVLAQSNELHFWFSPYHPVPLPTPHLCGE